MRYLASAAAAMAVTGALLASTSAVAAPGRAGGDAPVPAAEAPRSGPASTAEAHRSVPLPAAEVPRSASPSAVGTPRHAPAPQAKGHRPVPLPTVIPAVPYNGACGAGYVVTGHMAINSRGTVFLTHKASNGYYCAVTIRSAPGPRVAMDVNIEFHAYPHNTVSDPGQYTTYAGPVYLHAGDACVDWGGLIDYSASFVSTCW